MRELEGVLESMREKKSARRESGDSFSTHFCIEPPIEVNLIDITNNVKWLASYKHILQLLINIIELRNVTKYLIDKLN